MIVPWNQGPAARQDCVPPLCSLERSQILASKGKFSAKKKKKLAWNNIIDNGWVGAVVVWGARRINCF